MIVKKKGTLYFNLSSVSVSDLIDQLSASSFTHIDPLFSINGRNYKGGGAKWAEFVCSEAVSHKPCLSSCYGDVMISK